MTVYIMPKIAAIIILYTLELLLLCIINKIEYC
jgi:hypothetical protein